MRAKTVEDIEIRIDRTYPSPHSEEGVATKQTSKKNSLNGPFDEGSKRCLHTRAQPSQSSTELVRWKDPCWSMALVTIWLTFYIETGSVCGFEAAYCVHLKAHATKTVYMRSRFRMIRPG